MIFFNSLVLSDQILVSLCFSHQRNKCELEHMDYNMIKPQRDCVLEKLLEK